MRSTPFLGTPLVFALFFCLAGGVAPAQEGETVVAVEIHGRSSISADRIKDNLKTREGGIYSEQVLAEDIKNLYENEKFRILTVSRTVERVPGGVKVVVHISQDDRISGVRFRGVVHEKEDDLLALIGVTEESVVSRFMVMSYADMIRSHYQGKGFYLAEVNVWFEADGAERLAVFEIFEGEKVSIEEIEFRGVEQIDAGDLKKRIESKTPRVWIFSTSLKDDVLRKDIVRLNDYARGEGYLDARISLEEVLINDDGDGAAIAFRVQEGERYRVRSVKVCFGEWENRTFRNTVESDEFSAGEILELVEIEVGDFPRAPWIRRDGRRIEQFYSDRGYIRAQVAEVAREYSETEPVVDLTFWVVEDRKKTVRDVIVAGNTLTKDKVVRRELTLYPGDLFRKTEMDWSKNKLNSLQFFVDGVGQPRVFVDHLETSEPDKEDLYVEVEDGKTGSFFFTLGASTDGGLFGGGNIQKQNFDLTDLPDPLWTAPVGFFTNSAFHGGGQSLRISAMPGTVYSNYDVTFFEPYFFNTQPTPYSFTLRGYHSDIDYSEYDVTRTGIAPSLGKRLSRFWSISLTFRNEQIKMRNVTVQAPLEAKELEGGTGRRSVEIGARHRSIDNPWDPTKGFSNGISYEYTGGVLGNDLEMNRIYLNSKWRLPVYESASGKIHQIVLSGTSGWEHEQGDMNEVPIFERFFVGGSSGRFPIRGFKWQRVGPIDPIGGSEHVGGKFAYSLSAEYVVPLYTQYDSYRDTETTLFKGVAFFDAGGIGSDIHDSAEIRRMRSSYGVGLRITLPVFQGLPIALDYGIPIRRYAGDDRRSFSFSIKKIF
jgi:outer membrane protein insertion porin family